MIGPWLRFFRIVNLPTVPGDVWVGAVAVWAGVGMIADYGAPVITATFAVAFIYLFGLADNDIVGAATDVGRPIPEGLISVRAAKVARAACLAAACVAAIAPDPLAHRAQPPLWWVAAACLVAAILAYNRTKNWLLMGLCRGFSVACGGATALGALTVSPERIGDRWQSMALLVACMAVWTAYIAAVTKYSEGEELDAAKRRRVGFLVGAVVWLQFAWLVAFRSGLALPVMALWAVMVAMKRLLRHVSAS